MLKKIYSYLIFLSILVACNKSDDNAIAGYIRTIDVRNSNLKADQLMMALLYSTDGGKTFVQFPQLTTGQTYQVKVVDLHDGYIVDSADCFDLDWSASDPKPNKDTNGNIAEFTSTGSNKVLVTIINHYTAYDAKIWPGIWSGDQGTVETDSVGVKLKSGAGSTDSNGLVEDASDPNKFWLYNVYGLGNGEKFYTVFNPSTKNADQTIAVPSQVTPGGYTVSGSGTYDQCRKTFSLGLVVAFTDSTKYADTTKVRVTKPNGYYKDSVTSIKPHPYQVSYAFTYTFSGRTDIPKYCAPYNASAWTGVWTGDETLANFGNGTGSNDVNNITQDPSNPNKFIMDNFFGDNVTAYFILTPSTNYFEQIVTIPKQTTTDPGTIAAGSGTYDQCTGSFNMLCSYKAFNTTYKWTYKFHR